MQTFSLARFLPKILVCALGVALASPAHAATTTGFTLKATNVSIGGRGTASTTFTLTSVGGFTGQVGVACADPNTNLYPDLVLPDCSHPTDYLTVPANGSIQDKISFYPPWENQEGAALKAHRLSRGAHPVLACLLAGAGLLGFGLRRRLHGRLGLVLGVLGICLCSGLIGCLGQGGLQMTPGTYAYTLYATGNGATISTSVNVTVHCSSCS